MPRGKALLLALVCGLALGTPGAGRAEVQGFHYTRDVEVPSPGWVQVPLDLGAVQHMAPGGADLRVFSAAGGEVIPRIEPAVPRSERRPAESFRAQPAGDGWFLLVDVGADPVSHDRLFLAAAHPPLPTPDRIEGSADGAAWQPLAAGAPGRESGETTVSYPVTGERYLRLHWPRRPEIPRISAAAVETVTGPVMSVASPSADCEPGPPGATFCTLALPAAGQVVRNLAVEIEGKGVLGYRLYAPLASRWRPLAEGTWQPAGGRTRHLIPGGAEPVGAVLRLELYALGARPRLASYGVDLTVQTVLFQAAEPGRYTLAYGGAPPGRTRRPGPPLGVRPVWLEAGAESEHGLPALPPAATAPAVRLASGRLAASWRVAAPAAKPGLLVHLELPALVYGVARADLGNLRVMAGDHQIPFLRWSPEDPALAAEEAGLHFLKGSRRSGDSTLEIHLPEPGLPLTQAQLGTPALPLRRAVGLRYLEPATTPAREVRRRDRPVVVHENLGVQAQAAPPLRGSAAAARPRALGPRGQRPRRRQPAAPQPRRGALAPPRRPPLRLAGNRDAGPPGGRPREP